MKRYTAKRFLCAATHFRKSEKQVTVKRHLWRGQYVDVLAPITDAFFIGLLQRVRNRHKDSQSMNRAAEPFFFYYM